jgi:hypothetical protein
MAAGHKIGADFEDLWKVREDGCGGGGDARGRWCARTLKDWAVVAQAYPREGQRALLKEIGGHVPEVEGSASATRLSVALSRVGTCL